MNKSRNFKCTNNHIENHIVSDEVLILECKCGELSKRTLSMPRYFGNGAGGKSPSAR